MEIKIETKAALCEKHGAFESRRLFREIWSRCGKCAAEEQAAQREKEERAAREAERRAWESRVEGAGIPERFRDRTLENFVAETEPQRRALAFAEGYANDFAAAERFSRSALFCGRPGTGKTHLASGISLCLMKQGKTVMFTSVIRAIRRVKETWSRAATETESQVIAGMVFPDLLILDEVGVQFGSDTERMILFDILNERYEKRKACILLSNLPPDGVKEFLGERIFDRLREDGGQAVVFDWASHRKGVAQ